MNFLYIQKDDTQLKVVGSEYILFWVDIIDSGTRNILAISVSKARNMFVAVEIFFYRILWMNMAGQHPVSTIADGDGTWYLPQACQFLKLKHHLHFLYIRMRNALLKELSSISKMN